METQVVDWTHHHQRHGEVYEKVAHLWKFKLLEM